MRLFKNCAISMLVTSIVVSSHYQMKNDELCLNRLICFNFFKSFESFCCKKRILKPFKTYDAQYRS